MIAVIFWSLPGLFMLGLTVCLLHDAQAGTVIHNDGIQITVRTRGDRIRQLPVARRPTLHCHRQGDHGAAGGHAALEPALLPAPEAQSGTVDGMHRPDIPGLRRGQYILRRHHTQIVQCCHN